MAGAERLPNLFKKISKLFNYTQNVKYSEDDLDHPLLQISKKSNSNVHLSEVLDFAYDTLRQHIPFDRLGIALVDNTRRNLKLTWVRSEFPITQLKTGYTASVSKSLELLLLSRTPRIINNLVVYSDNHPESCSTKGLIMDGMLSNLTFPLIVNMQAIGVIFFSSRTNNTYSDQHINIFLPVAEHLSDVIRQSNLYGDLKLAKQKDVMLRTTLHDLKSPLGIIQGYIELLEEGLFLKNKSQHTTEVIETLKRNCQSLGHLLMDLTEVHSSNNAQPKLDKTTVSITSLLRNAVEIHYDVARKKNIRLEIGATPNNSLQTVVDQQKIMRVFDNLINNAIKFSNGGTTVSLHTLVNSSMVEISIIDQGPGIPDGEIDKLFKEYGKASTRPTAGESSTGLGLFICKQIVEAHGGKIWVQSQPDHGSAFTFTLPLLVS
ncbi:MAG: ATP-binding protein [Bdellovibrionales bacterium]